jgi:hypothetical protein
VTFLGGEGEDRGGLGATNTYDAMCRWKSNVAFKMPQPSRLAM